MPVALYFDHNIAHIFVTGLRRRGVDVLTAFEDDRSEWDDAALLDRQQNSVESYSHMIAISCVKQHIANGQESDFQESSLRRWIKTCKASICATWN